VSAGIVALFVLAGGFGGGLLVGISSQQAAINSERAKAAASVQAASVREEQQQGDYQARLAQVASAKAALDSAQAALDQQKRDLDARTAALNATSFADGVWVVGTDIQPGTYKAAQATGDCYWAKLNADESIIRNDIPGGPTTVTIEGSVNKFKSDRCGTWTKVG